jgi:phosphoserine phosphatase RsbU/P
MLGYHWIDDKHFALYLLDASGHGVGPALLSVSVLDTVRKQSLPDTDFRCPDQVLAGLNSRFQVKDEYGLSFTMWYGVFNGEDRTLRYASGGHPPAILVDATHRAIHLNDADGLTIGFFPDANYQSAIVEIPPAGTLFVFSDGCYEIQRREGEIWTDVWSREQMVEYLANSSPDDLLHLQALYRHSIAMQGGQRLEDDFSILCARFL